MKKTIKLFMIISLLILFVFVVSPNNVKALDTGLTFKADERYAVTKSYNDIPYTLEAEIKFDQNFSGNGGMIFSNYNLFTANAKKRVWYLQITDGGIPRFYYSNTNNENIDLYFNNVDVRTGDWVHVALAFDGTNNLVNFYMNGSLAQSLGANGDLSTYIKETSFHIGGDDQTQNRNQYFRGEMREVSVYGDLRGAAEVKNAYENGVDLTDSDLIAHYEFSGADAGKNLIDKSGNGFDARYENYWYDNQQLGAYDYSFAVIGDTQVISYIYPNNMHTIYDWIVDNKDIHKISHVFGVGDITEKWAKNDQEALKEWGNSKDAIYQMNGKVPYSLTRGNHDETKYYNQYFNEEAYTSQFDGFFDDTINTSYKTFKAGSVDYLLITLDFGASDEELEWANEVVATHPNHKVIVTTHGYLNHDGKKLDYDDIDYPSDQSDVDDGLSTSYNNGQEMWDKFISQHPNIVLVFSGHISEEDIVTSQSVGVHGNVVTEMLIDFQWVDRDVEPTGMITMLYFSDNGNKVEVAAYSPIKNKYYKPSNHFVLDLSSTNCTNHNFKVKYDDYNHWFECMECGLAYGHENHVYENPIATGHGTQIATCSCGLTKEISGASNEVTLNLQELIEKYYNTGSYIKNTKIYIDSAKAREDLASYFHANVSTLERTTYYDGNKLWMSAGNDYSGYGTSSDGHLTMFRVSLDGVFGEEKVVSNLPGMEEYYVTLHDFMLGQHTSNHSGNKTLNLNDGWTYLNGVYTNTNPDVLDAFRLFTAPLWLDKDKNNENYVSFTKATIDALSGKLVLKLWVSAENKGIFADGYSNIDSEGNYLFSEAIISEYYWKGNTSTGLVGEGSESNPYLITGMADLLYFKENAHLYAGKHVKLTTDIDLKGQCLMIYSFAGIFDGAGHSIKGLAIDEAMINTGLFRTLEEGGVIKNLSVYGEFKGLSIIGGIAGTSYGLIENCYNYATITGKGRRGGIVGLAYGDIKNCVNYGDILNDANGWFVGGIVGESFAHISDCQNHGTVYGTDLHVGGIVGSHSNGNITNCLNSGDVIHVGEPGKGAWGLGGIAGCTTGMITGCTNNGEIIISTTNGSGQVGGIVGKAYNVVSDCVNNGNIVTKFIIVGGIVGDGYATTTVSNCKNYGSVTGTSSVGGIIGNLQAGSVIGCENHGVVTGTGNPVGGIVGKLASGKVQDSINKGNVKGQTKTGGVVGEGVGTIVNCENHGQINDGSGWDIGGVAGFMTGDVINSRNYGTVRGSGTHIGGIVGSLSSGNITDCTNEGLINGFSWGAGGIVAYVGNQSSIISGCVNKGNVQGGQGQVGGIVGKAIGTITECVNEGVVNGSVAGGIVGDGYATTTVSNCDNYGSVNGAGTISGIVGNLRAGSIISCENHADITCTGSIVGGIVGNLVSGKVQDSINRGKVKGTASNSTDVGGIAGIAVGTIDNCENYGQINEKNGLGIAGIVGDINGTVSNCRNYGTVSGSGTHVAGIVGDLASGNITNCTNEGLIEGFSWGAGGIVASVANQASIISGCVNKGNIQGGQGQVGGIVGKAKGTITECVNEGVVNGSIAGGIVGHGYANTYVEKSDNYGEIKGAAELGGIVGKLDNGSINDCINHANVTGTGTHVAGILGKTSNGTIANCENKGKIYGSSYTAGVVGQTPWVSGGKVIISNCTNNGEITNTAYFGAGIVGAADNTVVTGCINNGFINSKADCVGGIAAAFYVTSSMDNCTNNGKVYANTNIGGLIFDNRAVITNCTNTGELKLTASWGAFGVNALTSVNTGTLTNCTNTGKAYLQNGQEHLFS